MRTIVVTSRFDLAVRWLQEQGLSPRQPDVLVVTLMTPHRLRGIRLEPDESIKVLARPEDLRGPRAAQWADLQEVVRLLEMTRAPEPPSIGESCCGRCPGGTCYVDSVTGA